MSTSVIAADKPVIRQVSSEGIRHSILICGKLTQLINEKSEVVWQVNENSRDGSVPVSYTHLTLPTKRIE